MIDPEEFPWSGNAHFNEADGPYVVVLTPAHKRLMSRLDLAAYTPEDMREAMKGLELDAEEAEYAATDGLRVALRTDGVGVKIGPVPGKAPRPGHARARNLLRS